MATQQTTLIVAKYAENAQTTQYTSTSSKTVIDKLTASNTTSSAVVFSVNLVENGGSASVANRILNRTIAAGETYRCPEVVGHSLESGAFISTLCGTSSALVIRASGRVIT